MIETKKQLRQEAENAEIRAVTHFQKLNKIEQILKQADFKKEMYYETVQKIKKSYLPKRQFKKIT